jgi:hypothetical protein
MMKYIASVLIVMMTFNASAGEQVVLNVGEKAPFQGLLVDDELFQYIQDRIDKIDAAESALIKQNDMLIEVQKQKIVLEFERDIAIDKFEQHKWTTTILWFLVGALAVSK